ncbi:MAG: hypothetical protein ACYCO3_16065 [Mycobacteriales bacterium]
MYFAEDEACVWAEWYRHLAEAAVPPASALPRDLWRWLIAPSAARPASLVLAVFIPADEFPDHVVPIASTQVADAPVPPTGMRT